MNPGPSNLPPPSTAGPAALPIISTLAEERNTDVKTVIKSRATAVANSTFRIDDYQQRFPKRPLESSVAILNLVDPRTHSLQRQVEKGVAAYNERRDYLGVVSKHCAEAKKMLRLEDDWDGDGAPAIPPIAFKFATQFVLRTAEVCYDIHKVKALTLKMAPGGEASVIMFAKSGKGSLYAECFLDEHDRPYIQFSCKVRGESRPTLHRSDSASILALSKSAAHALVELTTAG